MKFKHSYNIHPHTKKGSDKCALFMVVSVNGERKEVPLSMTVPAAAYNKLSRSIVPAKGYTTATTDNLHLQQHIARLERIFAQWELSDSTPTLFDILEEYKSLTNGVSTPVASSVMTVRAAFDLYLQEAPLSDGWSEGTTKHKRAVGNNICATFGKKPLNSLNDTNLLQLISDKSSDMRASSLDKFMGDVRCFLRWCSKHGYYQGTSHNTFHPVIKGANSQKEIIYLTTEELHALETHQWQPNQQYLEHVVDAFLFACFSGLRHSDVYNLKRSRIHDGSVHAHIIKTEKFTAIPLNVHSQRVLDKYSGYQDTKDHPFPVCSDQKSNDYIKEACQFCGIDTPLTVTYYKDGKRIEETKPKHEWISFHSARRTFISQAFLLGIPPDIIIKFTGHSSTKQLKPYLAISEKQKQDSMSLFNKI